MTYVSMESIGNLAVCVVLTGDTALPISIELVATFETADGNNN